MNLQKSSLEYNYDLVKADSLFMMSEILSISDFQGKMIFSRIGPTKIGTTLRSKFFW